MRPRSDLYPERSRCGRRNCDQEDCGICRRGHAIDGDRRCVSVPEIGGIDRRDIHRLAEGYGIGHRLVDADRATALVIHKGSQGWRIKCPRGGRGAGLVGVGTLAGRVAGRNHVVISRAIGYRGIGITRRARRGADHRVGTAAGAGALDVVAGGTGRRGPGQGHLADARGGTQSAWGRWRERAIDQSERNIGEGEGGDAVAAIEQIALDTIPCGTPQIGDGLGGGWSIQLEFDDFSRHAA